jgi:hypothetical protein
VCTIVAIWFLYTRTYQAIGQVEALASFGVVAVEERIDLDRYNKVQLQFEQRAIQIRPHMTRNPFVIYETETPEISDDVTTTTATQTTSLPTSTIESTSEDESINTAL